MTCLHKVGDRVALVERRVDGDAIVKGTILHTRGSTHFIQSDMEYGISPYWREDWECQYVSEAETTA